MAVIDWPKVATNALWILGLSIVLAAFSYHDWLAAETGRTWRELFKRRSWRLPATGGFALTCAGWALAQAAYWWTKAGWAALAVWFAWKFVGAARHRS